MSVTRPAWALTATQKKTDTFAGGVPYLAPGETWPKDPEGDAWRFLVQIALKDVPDLGLDLPQEGYLQFFHSADDLFGMNLDNPGDPSIGSKCFVRHVTNVEDQGDHMPEELLNEESALHYTPLEKPSARVYYIGELVRMSPFENSVDVQEEEDDNDGFFSRMSEAVEDWFNEGGASENFDEEEPAPLAQEEYEFHLGGYANFTQEDFRNDPEAYVLLLGSESGKNIMWGDMGVAGYWLSPEDADSLSFENAFLYWDCY